MELMFEEINKAKMTFSLAIVRFGVNNTTVLKRVFKGGVERTPPFNKKNGHVNKYKELINVFCFYASPGFIACN